MFPRQRQWTWPGVVLFGVFFFLGAVCRSGGTCWAKVQEAKEVNVLETANRVSAVQGPKDLAQCVRLALELNPGLAQARFEEQIQSKGQDLARSKFFPGVSLQGSYYRFEYPGRVIMAEENNQPGVYDKDVFSGLVRFSLPIYQGGRRLYDLQISKLAIRYAQKNRVSTQQDLLLNLAATYYKLLQIRKAQESVKASLAALDAELERISLQLSVGRAAPVDRMKVAVRQAELRVDLENMQADEGVLLARMAQLIGLSRDRNDFQVIGTLRVRPLELLDLSTAMHQALDKRPEFAAAQAKLQQARLGVRNARAERLPRMNLIFDYGLRAGSPYDQDEPAGSIDHQDSWSAGLVLDWPLFEGGAIFQHIAMARLAVGKAEQGILAVRLSIEKELKEARSHSITARKRLQVSDQNRHLAKEVLRIERLKYKNGKNSINDVLDAQAAWYRAELGYARAVADFNLAGLEWSRALGQDLSKLLLASNDKEKDK